jgi:hypothetical protein
VRLETRRSISIHEKILILLTAFCTFLGGIFAAAKRMDLFLSMLAIPIAGWLLAFLLKVGERK